MNTFQTTHPMRRLLLIATVLASVAMLALPARADQDSNAAPQVPRAVALHATFKGPMHFGNCGGDGGPRICNGGGYATSCVILGTTANPLAILSCGYQLNISYPVNCAAAVGYGSGALEYGGVTYLQQLTVVSHGATFTASGETVLGPEVVLHTVIHGVHSCLQGYYQVKLGQFSGTTDYAMKS